VTDQNKNPVLDEQTFEKLLEAAYVLQEHNRKMRELEESLESQRDQLVQQEMAREALQPRSTSESNERSPADSDYTLTLSEIVEAQRQIQMHNLGLDKAMAVVAERVARITHSSGAAIGILEGNIVRYRAGTGSPALPIGTESPLDRAICVASVRTGKVIRSEDINTEFLFDPELCRGRGIRSLLAVPIYHDGDIVGALELYFDRIHGFAEQDIHTCQLMAGLVTEAISRDAEINLKNSMAAERSTMLAAIEKLKPTLATVAESGHAGASSASISTASKAQFPCWKCGSSLLAEEQFCGKCGAARSRGDEPSDMQSKIASAWNTQRASLEASAAAPPHGKMAAMAGTARISDLPQSTMHPQGTEPTQREDVDLEEAWDTELENFSASERAIKENFLSQASVAESTDEDILVVSSSDELSSNTQDETTALVAPQREDVVWTSAAKARQFLESVSGKREPGALARYWHSRRGDFYLGFAIILVILVIRWGIWSEPSVGAAGQGNTISGIRRKHFDPNANLSTFDKLLISMGLAEAPDPPEYRGNPDTQVWVDLHTALYYCPGSDLYGKTPKGKTTNQRDAQLDQFEPAYRKACD
jgi:putative methionine-R-sulfoxide reductase with GAF domain